MILASVFQALGVAGRSLLLSAAAAAWEGHATEDGAIAARKRARYAYKEPLANHYTV